MVLTATETGVDDTVTLEGGNLINSSLGSQEPVYQQLPISVKKEVSYVSSF